MSFVPFPIICFLRYRNKLVQQVESVLELSEKYIVTSAVNIDRNMVELRIVNETKPFDNGVGYILHWKMRI